jgi:hypothetical protein
MLTLICCCRSSFCDLPSITTASLALPPGLVGGCHGWQFPAQLRADRLGFASKTAAICVAIVILIVSASILLSSHAMLSSEQPPAFSENLSTLLPFPRKLVDGKYDTQYLDLLRIPPLCLSFICGADDSPDDSPSLSLL